MSGAEPEEVLHDLNQRLIEASAALGARLESSIKILSAVSRLTSVPVATQELDQGASLILRILLSELNDVASCSLMLFDQESGFLTLLAGTGQADFLGEVDGPYNKNLRFRPGEGIAGRVFKDGKARYYDQKDLKQEFIRSEKRPTAPNSLACLPLTSNKVRLGIINITFGQDRPFDYPRKRDLFLLSEVIANIIQAFILRKEVSDSMALLGERAMRLENEIRFRKHAEEEKKQLEKQLRESQKMEAIGTLSGGIAHDFNNFLQGIAGYTQLMLTRQLSPEKSRDYLQEIDGIVDRASTLIQSLLTFSRRLEPSLKPADLKSIIQEAGRIIKAAIPRMIRLETSVPPNLPPVWGDPNQIEQILLNLATNARDAMPQGGRFRILAKRTTMDEDFCDQHLGSIPGEYIRLDISDTGQGIPPEALSRIFEPFYTSKQVGRGTGLGLSVVYGIVKTHGGYITCESETGRGATFRIWLRVCPGKQGLRVRKPTAPTDLLGGHETILVVDDVAAILETNRTALSECGYQVYTASDGEEALEIFKENRGRIDLVLLDLSMPGMGGEKCLGEMMRIDPDCKVIVTSGFSSEAQARELTSLGALGFLGKPYRLAKLLSIVRWAFEEN